METKLTKALHKRMDKNQREKFNEWMFVLRKIIANVTSRHDFPAFLMYTHITCFPFRPIKQQSTQEVSANFAIRTIVSRKKSTWNWKKKTKIFMKKYSLF